MLLSPVDLAIDYTALHVLIDDQAYHRLNLWTNYVRTYYTVFYLCPPPCRCTVRTSYRLPSTSIAVPTDSPSRASSPCHFGPMRSGTRRGTNQQSFPVNESTALRRTAAAPPIEPSLTSFASTRQGMLRVSAPPYTALVQTSSHKRLCPLPEYAA